MLLVDDLAAGGTKNLRHTPRGLVTLHALYWGYLSYCNRDSDLFQDWWAKVTHGAKNGGSFSEMMGPSLLN